MANVLEGFLVKLGFNVDQDGLKRFQGSLNAATHAVAKVSQAAVGVGVAMATAFVKANSEVNKLYKVSNDTGASIRGVEALSHAFERVGGSSDEALQAVGALANNIKSNTRFAEMVTSRFGVQLKDRNGNLRDMSQIFIELRNKISKIAEVNPELAKTQAEALGLGNAFNTMMKDDFLAEWQRASREMAAFGDSMDRNATKAHDLQNSLSRVWDTFAAGSKTLAMDFLEASGLEKWFDNLSTSLTKKVPALVRTLGKGMKSYAKGEWTISGVVKSLFTKRAADNALAEGDLDAETEGNPELQALLEKARAQQAKVRSPIDKAKEAYQAELAHTSGIIDGTTKPTEASVYHDDAKRVDSLTGKKPEAQTPAPAPAQKKLEKPKQQYQIVYDDDGNELRIPVKPTVEEVPGPRPTAEAPEAQPERPAPRLEAIPRAAPQEPKPQKDDIFARDAEKLSQEMRELEERARRFKDAMFKESRAVPNSPVGAMVREAAGSVTNNTRTESKVANVTVNQTINVQTSDPMEAAQAVQRETKESISRNTVTNLM